MPITGQCTTTGWRQPHDLSYGISEGAANLVCLPIELSLPLSTTSTGGVGLKRARLVPATGRRLGDEQKVAV